MKSATFTVLLLTAAAAFAEPAVSPDGRYHAAWPTRLPGYVSPSRAAFEAAGWTAASPERIAQEEAAQAAAQAEAEASRIAALVQGYGAMVAVLRANLVAVGWDLPCDAEAVTADLMERAAYKLLDADGRAAKDDIFQTYSILQSKGVSNADIATIWNAIKPTED